MPSSGQGNIRQSMKKNESQLFMMGRTNVLNLTSPVKTSNDGSQVIEGESDQNERFKAQSPNTNQSLTQPTRAGSMRNSELRSPLKGVLPNGIQPNFGRGSETFNQNGHKLSVYSMPSPQILSPNAKQIDAANSGHLSRMHRPKNNHQTIDLKGSHPPSNLQVPLYVK